MDEWEEDEQRPVPDDEPDWDVVAEIMAEVGEMALDDDEDWDSVARRMVEAGEEAAEDRGRAG